MDASVASNEPSRKAQAGRKNLDSLTVRRRTTGQKAAARAALTRNLRIILPVAAAALIAGFFVNARPDRTDDAFLNDFADIDATPQNLTTSNPRFSGVDANGNPYDITAASATQRPGGERLVELNRPRAIISGEGDQSVVAAEAGLFDSEAKLLNLNDGVTFEHAVGADDYVLNTPAAIVSIEGQTLVADNGVEGRASDGSTLSADRMTVYNEENRVVFDGNFSMKIMPKRGGGEANVADAELRR